MRRRTLTDTEIIDMYLSGVDSMTVGLNANCDAQTVLKIVRAAGHLTRPPGGVKKHKPSSISIEQAAQLYRSGLSVQEVADKAGLDRSTMHHRLRAAGVEIRSIKQVYSLKKRQGRPVGRPPKG